MENIPLRALEGSVMPWKSRSLNLSIYVSFFFSFIEIAGLFSYVWISTGWLLIECVVVWFDHCYTFDQFYIIFLFNGPFWELKLLLDDDYLSNLVSTCVMTLISGILVAYTMVQSTGLDEWGRETIQSQIIIIIIIIIM